jgi:hypothetical protein
VEDAPSAMPLTASFDEAQRLIGETIGGSKILSIAQDDMAASIVIGVDRVTPAVAHWFADRGNRFVVQVAQIQHLADTVGGVSTWGNNDAREITPVAGGETISQVEGCTSAFPASRNGAKVLITAGHCHESGTWKLGNPVSSVIGSTAESHWQDSLRIDAAAITIDSGLSQPCIVRVSTCVSFSFQTQAIVQGMPIFKAGSRTGEKSGSVTSANMSVADMASEVATNVCTLAGDSGGVLYVDNGDNTVTPLGISHASTAPQDPTDQDSDCLATGYTSFFQNWRYACPILDIDFCPTGTTTIGVARPYPSTGQYQWILTNNNVNPVPPYLLLGQPAAGDIPVVGDWDGNGVDSIGVARPDAASGKYKWILSNDNVGTTAHLITPYRYFGDPAAGDVPVVGDWDGNGVDTIGVAHPYPSTGQYQWLLTNDNINAFGGPSYALLGRPALNDIPVVGDWNGDLVDSIGVARPDAASDKFLWMRSNQNVGTVGTIGAPNYPLYGRLSLGDVPLVGDWNKNLVDTFGVARPYPSTGQYQWLLTNDNVNPVGGPNYPLYGQPGAGDVPVVGDWNRS